MRSIIKSRRVQVTEAPAATPRSAASVATAAPNVSHEKTVRLLEDGQRTHAIELTCSCGEVTLLELRYDDAPPPESTPDEPASAPDDEVVDAAEAPPSNEIEDEV